MTNRVRFDPAGLRVSLPGVDVDTATRQQLSFRAEDRAVPVIFRLGGSLPASWEESLTLMYPTELSSPPLSIVYWSTIQPTATTELYVVSGLSSVKDFLWPVSYNAAPLGSVGLVVTRLSDRITVANVLDGSSSGLSALGGWISAIVFDYQQGS